MGIVLIIALVLMCFADTRDEDLEEWDSIDEEFDSYEREEC